ncbi:hypothetical protein D4Z78_06415 [Okeania hirsuta]|nr:hypothetical protein D4Z78_06415 [Okeania hirsuta]
MTLPTGYLQLLGLCRYEVADIIPIPKNNAILPMRLQLLNNNNISVMFFTFFGIKPRYIISLNPTPYCLLPTVKEM